MAFTFVNLIRQGLSALLAGESYAGTFDLEEDVEVDVSLQVRRKKAPAWYRTFLPGDDPVDPLGSTTGGFRDWLLEAYPRVLVECPECRVGASGHSVKYRFEFSSDLDGEGGVLLYVSMYDARITQYEAWVRVSPYLCVCNFDEGRASFQAVAVTGYLNGGTPFRSAHILSDSDDIVFPTAPLFSGSCIHSSLEQQASVPQEPDQLGLRPTLGPLYRGLTHNGNRCQICWPGALHSIDPSLANSVKGFSSSHDDLFSEIFANLFTWRYIMLKRPRLSTLSEVTVTACSEGYPLSENSYFPTKDVILLSHPGYKGRRKVPGHRVWSWNMPLVGGYRSLAMWRVLVAACLPAGTRVYICNGVYHSKYQLSADFVTDDMSRVEYPPSFGLTVAPAGACSFVSGYVPLLDGHLGGFLAHADLYGFDEIWINSMPKAVVIEDIWDLSSAIISTHPGGSPGLLSYRGPRGPVDVNLDGSRRSVAAALARVRAFVAVPQHAPLPASGLFVPCAIRDFQGPTRYIQQHPEAISARSNVIVWVTFGTHGDMIPAKPMMRWLASAGYLVFWIPANTPAEGTELLRSLETGQSVKQFRLWVEACRGVASIPFTTIAPYFIPTASIPCSFEPPLSLLTGLDMGLGRAGQLLFHAFFGGTTTIRVGSWGTYDSVPRSTDGQVFDTWIAPTGPRPIKKAISLGSSTEHHEVDGAVEVPPGDHRSFFQNVQVAYVVGAGTAQTAASCGCRVVALSDKCDRAFKMPTNAGAGMVFGLRPNRILAHLVNEDPGRATHLRQRLGAVDIPHLVHFFINVWASRCAFLLLFLSAYTTRRLWSIKLAPGLWETLVVNVLPFQPSIWLILSASTLGTLVKQGLARLGVEVADVARWILYLALDLYSFPPFFAFLYLNWPFLWAVLLSSCMKYVGRVVISGLLSLFAFRPTGVVLDFRFFTVLGFPVVHTRLRNVVTGSIAEGSFVRTVGAYEPYRFVVLDSPSDFDPHTWQLSLPVHLSWQDITNTQVPTACYSLWHNCQVQVLQAAGYNLALLGPGWVLLIPMVTWMIGTYVALACILLGLSSIVFALTPVLELVATTNVGYAPLSVGLAKLQLILAILLTSSSSFLERAHAAAKIVQTAWGPTRAEVVGNLLLEAAKIEPRDMPLPEKVSILQQWMVLTYQFQYDDKTMKAILSLEGPPQAPVATVDYSKKLSELMRTQSNVSYDLFAAIASTNEDSFGVDSDDKGLALWIVENAASFCSSRAEDLGSVICDNAQTLYWGAGLLTQQQYESEISVYDDAGYEFTKWFFFDAEEEVPKDEGEVVPEEAVEFASSAVASLYHSGADFEQAISAACTELAGYYAVEDGSSDGMETATALFDSYLEARQHLQRVADSATNWWFVARKEMVSLGIPIFVPFEFAYLLSSRAMGEMSRMASLIVSGLLLILEREGSNPNVRTALGYALAGVLDVVDQRHRMSPKPAWALLLARTKMRLNRGDSMLASMHLSTYIPPDNYTEWANRMKTLMRGASPDVDQLLSTPPTRGLFFPKNTYGIASNQQYIEGFDVHIVETERERKRLEDTIKYSAKQGIDGAWLATQDRMATSLSRYTVDRPIPSSLAKAKVIEAADALYDAFPEMYEAPRAMTVDSVIKATEWKYSAGLPFLPIIKKRSTLLNSHWIHAIREAAAKIVMEGDFPGIAFHAFPKNQIVALDTAVGKGGSKPKAIRTVTAGDRITAIAYNMLAMERNKRLPPARALVLPSFRRTEGGMQVPYQELAKHANYFVGDATAFDSSCASELVIEGPLQLWRRGIEGRYGERASTTFMDSYYTALADGIIVSMYDGSVVRKTGGGGTGSAATSSDNRDWVRIALIGAWSMVTGMPCSAFREHVTLANASDDIVFSCDDTTASLINEWKHVMFKEYGVSFSFEGARLSDGLLHLTIVEEPEYSLYAELGLDPPKFSVRHDPARLFLMRSEYRADRMKMSSLASLDCIVTQDIGHAYLTAHTREAYADVADEWAKAAADYAAHFFDGVEVVKASSPDGLTVMAQINIPGALTSDILNKWSARVHPSQRAQYIEKRKASARRWLRSRRLPSYREVFQMWAGKPLPVEQSSAAKRYRKLAVFDAPMPFIDLVRNGLEQVAIMSSLYPKALKKLHGEEDIYAFSSRYTHSDFTIEKFVYWALADSIGRVPSTPEMVAAVRTSAYGAATDVWGFMIYANSDAGRSELASAPDSLKAANYIRVLLSLVLYTISDRILNRLYKTRILGTFVSLIFILLWDLDTLYSFLSTWWWFVYGVNSVVISNLSVKDPYLPLKLLSITLAASLPSSKWAPGWVWTHRFWAAYPLQVVTAGMRFKVSVPLAISAGLTVPDSPIARIVHPLREADFYRDKGGVLTAGMASGKSSIFPAALLKESCFRRVILLMPTNVLVNDYKNPFLDSGYITKVTMDNPPTDPIPEYGLVVMTAGLFASRFTYGYPPLNRDSHTLAYSLRQRDIVLLDEISRSTMEQAHCLAICRLSSPGAFLGLTGTPSGPLVEALSANLIHVPTSARFITEARDLEGDFVTTVNKVFASAATEGKRAMISVLSEAQASKIARSCVAGGLGLATVVSRLSPFVPSTGHVVATTIADFGVSVEPGPDVLVDEGRQIAQVPSTVAIVDADGRAHRSLVGLDAKKVGYRRISLWSSPEIKSQRHARVGRVSNGIVYAPSQAGLGPLVSPVQSILKMSRQPIEIFREYCLLMGSHQFIDALTQGIPFHGLLLWDEARAAQRKRSILVDPKYYVAFVALVNDLGSMDEAYIAASNPDDENWLGLLAYLGITYIPCSATVFNVPALQCVRAPDSLGGFRLPFYMYNGLDNLFSIT